MINIWQPYPYHNNHISTALSRVYCIYLNIYWLVVLTPLKNISQWEGLSHILWKIKKCSKPPARDTFGTSLRSRSKCFTQAPASQPLAVPKLPQRGRKMPRGCLPSKNCFFCDWTIHFEGTHAPYPKIAQWISACAKNAATHTHTIADSTRKETQHCYTMKYITPNRIPEASQREGNWRHVSPQTEQCNWSGDDKSFSTRCYPPEL